MCKEKEMKQNLAFSFILCALLSKESFAESPLQAPSTQTQKEAKQSSQNNPNTQNQSNIEKESLDYLLDDSKTKFPVSDYIWQKPRTTQNITNYFNNNTKKGVGNITYLGIDGHGNEIYMDSNNQLVDKEGNLILNTQGNPLKLIKDKEGRYYYVDSNGNLYDSNGRPILDDYGNPVKAVIENDEVFLVDSKGNLTDYKGRTKRDSKGKPLSFANRKQSLKEQMLQEQRSIDKKLQAKQQSQKPRNTKKTNTQATKKPQPKPTHTDNAIDMEILFLEAMQERNPLYDEYGDSEYNLAYAEALGANASGMQDLGHLFRDSYLGSRNDTQMQKENNTRYGDSRFSNQENIDEATNEHKLYRTITAGKLIPCILLTPINSEIEGLVSAQVEQDIYAYMGRAVLIPRGSKVIGFYKNDNEVGQARIQITWREIITPQGVNIILTNAVTGDSEGYAGAKGYLNNRYWQRYGMGITMQTLANAITFGIANGTQKENAGVGTSYYTGQILAQSQNDINSVLRQIVSKQNNIKAIVQIKAGSRIYITPTAHIWFPIPKNNEVMARYFDDEE